MDNRHSTLRTCLAIIAIVIYGFIGLATDVSAQADDGGGGAVSRVKWRFKLDGQYSMVRPINGPKGIVYAVDVSGTLYSISPNGVLMWKVQGAGNKGVAMGNDGSIYTASENAIKAFTPKGELKWTFELNPRAFITLGVSVGPDGNIYSVAVESIGVFSLTPEGQLRWATPERYSRPIVEYSEIVFGPNGAEQQLYFYANGRIRSVRLSDGATVFPISSIEQPFGQPFVSPLDGTVHANVLAYTPNGDTIWRLFNIYNSSIGFPSANVGIDGTHYVVYPGQRLYAINPDGSIKYQRDLAQPFNDPVSSPDGTMLVIGAQNSSEASSAIVGFTAADGVENWRENLPPENGNLQSITTRARFSVDGDTAYVNTVAVGQTSSIGFIYAVDARRVVGNLAPHPVIGADRTAGAAPITIHFNSTGSSDPDGTIVGYNWDFGDGGSSTAANPNHVYTSAGTYIVKLTVTDNGGATGETFRTLEFTGGGCVTNCARVTDIVLTSSPSGSNFRVDGVIKVQNENGTPLPNVVVRYTWAGPFGPAMSRVATTNANGIATGAVTSPPGNVTLGISLLEASGYTFDAGNSLMSRTITLP